MRVDKEANVRKSKILDVAELTLLYSSTVFDDLTVYGGEERQRKIAAFTYNLGRLLGMEEESLREAVLPIFG